jgi:predicted alpha/beta-hydrolase family hydrolase
MTEATELRFDVPDAGSVSALALTPADPRAVFVFAHGAGAGMRHVFMASFAEGLAERGVATLRYQFPYSERGSSRVDSPAVAQAAVRAACAEAQARWAGLPLFAGGKSFGGRMTSQAEAAAPLAGVRGLVFVGFPLHPAGKPAKSRADHLAQVGKPMLFLQGTRDELATSPLIEEVVAGLGARAHRVVLPGADHAFHVRKMDGGSDAATRTAMLAATADWIEVLR